MDWLSALVHFRKNNTACVVVLITQVSGSAPRAAGTRMLVTQNEVHGTIGGGALELEGISHARALMVCAAEGGNGVEHKGDKSDSLALVSCRQFNLAPELSQCCGGKVTLQFDCHFKNDFIVHVFGAGHVAQEVARLVQRLPCVATFHDTRADWLSQVSRLCERPDTSMSSGLHTKQIESSIFEHVESLDARACFLVMTHSHEMDMDVVEAVLTRADAVYCGLIASESKAAKFRNRLKRKGFSEAEVARLNAPLGQTIKTGNTPMEVAIAAMGDVLHARNQVGTHTACHRTAP